LDFHAGHVPTRTGRDDEVVGSLVVERVGRRLVVLRVRRDRARVVVLVVQHVAG
jgi:hypothetical protein